ncbi:MAG TPA: hypothetical protein GXX53_00720 [Tissierellia bacterium]|nr:hypothetical protein [Tissierellia bacterium]
MRKKILKAISLMGIFLILFIVGCDNYLLEKNDKEIYEALESTLTSSNTEESDGLLYEFKSIVDSNNEPYVLVQFIDENIKNATEEEAAVMILILEEVQKEYIQEYTDEIFMEDNQMELLRLSGTELFFDEANIGQIENVKLKDIVERIFKGKYKLINMEGGFYPGIDYEKLKEYNRYLSDEIRGYIEIKALNSNKPAVLDAEITISFDELGERLIQTEKYIQKYPQGVKFEEVLRIYGDYLRLYLEGSDNSPIYEYETREIKKDILKSYKNMKGNNKLITAKIISKYIDIIEYNKNIIDENVLSRVPKLLSEAVATLESIK